MYSMLAWSHRRRSNGVFHPVVCPDVLDTDHSGDLALARRVMARVPAAIEEFALRLRCVPRHVAGRNRQFGQCLSADDLRDATQESVVIIWQKLGEFRGDAAFETWCCAIAGGVFMNAVRRRNRMHATAEVEVLDAGGLLSVRDPEHKDFSHVHRCIDKLADDEAFVVRARAFDECPFEDIAAGVQRPVEALKARYYRALRKLQLCLAPYLRREQ